MNSKDDALGWILKGAGITLVGLILTKVLGYAYRALLARGLGPEQYGVLNLGLAIVSIVSMVALLGYNLGIERFIGYYQDKKEQQGLLHTALWYTLPLSIAITILLFFIAQPLGLVFENKSVVAIIQLLAITIPLMTFTEIALATLKSTKRIEASVTTKRILEPLMRILATIVIFVIGLKTIGAAAAYVFGMVVLTGVCWWFLREDLKNFWTSTKVHAQELFTFSWPLLLTGVVYNIITWTDTLMIGYYLDESLVGIYSVAIPTAGLLMMPQMIFESLFVPIVTRLHKEEKKQEIREIYQQVTKYMTVLAIPLLAILILFGKGLLPLLFGKGYEAAYAPLVILGIGYLFSFTTGPNGQLFHIFNETKAKLYLRIGVLLVNVVLNAMLIPIYGISGAALATAIAIALANLINVTWYYTKEKINPFSKEIAIAGICALLSILSLELLKIPLFALNILPTDLLWTILLILALSVIYFVLILLTKTCTIKELGFWLRSLKNKV